MSTLFANTKKIQYFLIAPKVTMSIFIFQIGMTIKNRRITSAIYTAVIEIENVFFPLLQIY